MGALCLVHHLYMDAKHQIESLHLSVELHLHGDYTFGHMATFLAHANSSGALRELVITFDIQGAANEEDHHRLLVKLSDETDVTAINQVLTTRRYARLETVEIGLRVGHLEHRPVKSREALWMERVEAQLRAIQLKGILRRVCSNITAMDFQMS